MKAKMLYCLHCKSDRIHDFDSYDAMTGQTHWKCPVCKAYHTTGPAEQREPEKQQPLYDAGKIWSERR